MIIVSIFPQRNPAAIRCFRWDNLPTAHKSFTLPTCHNVNVSQEIHPYVDDDSYLMSIPFICMI